MKQSQKAAAESKAQSHRGFRLVKQGGIIELKLLQGIPQVIVFCPICRIQAAVNHRRYLFIAWKWGLAGIFTVCNCITHPGIPYIFDAGCNIAYHAGAELLTGNKLTCSKITHLNYIGLSSGCHHTDRGAFADSSLHNTAENNHTLIGIINGIKNQCLQRRFRIPLWRRYFMDNSL